MRREIAAAAHFETASLQLSGGPGDTRSDGIRVRLFPVQPHPQPVVSAGRCVLQKNWWTIVDRNQNIDGTIVIKVSDGHSAGGVACSYCRSGSLARVLKPSSRIVK